MVTSTELNALELYDLNRTEIKKKSLKLKDRMQTNYVTQEGRDIKPCLQ